MSRRFRFNGLYTDQGWMDPAWVTIDENGLLSRFESTPSVDRGWYEKVPGFAVPGYQNAHSHAFQYAMAGLAEHLPVGAQSDDFWSWRHEMYRLALSLNPEQFEAIAAMLYAEMVRNGYTSVAEFHYLHNDKQGRRYADPAEMGRRLLSAAELAGIRITLVPIFYQRGGFDQPASDEQRRFLSANCADYLELLEQTSEAVSQCTHARLGAGIHSLRAVATAELLEVAAAVPEGLPRHIHVAEQTGEVEQCLSALNARPVRWLLDHLPLDKSWHLVHATHVDEDELDGITAAGTHVVLCPSTEGNLGDGIFPLGEFLERGGRWSIGTDSHVGLNPNEELRLLDYGQRLIRRRRNVLCRNAGDDSGSIAFTASVLAGRAAMGDSGSKLFAVGQPFDAAVYDAAAPLIACASAERRLSRIVYASGANTLLGTILGGQWIVHDRRHRNHTLIRQRFLAAMKRLPY